jgi:hypothetical protein
MRKILLLAATASLIGTTPASAWWHAGGVTPGGTVWHGGGTGYGARWGGAYHPGSVDYYHGYSGYHYGGYYRAPVPVPVYHPVGTFAAGAAVGAVAASSAAATAQYYSQPPTVVNNYYN